MPIYALLGATGATGSSVLRYLLNNPSPDLQLNILVRSKTKLLQTFPLLHESTTLKVNIFEGNSTSQTSLIPCLTAASAIFMCVGQNGSPPGTTLNSDTVAAVIAALSILRKQHSQSNPSSTPDKEEEREANYQPPTVIQLRSASLNPPLAAQVPRLVHKAVLFCLHHNYTDLHQACELYKPAAASGLLHYVFVDPPTIHDAEGTVCTGHRLLMGEGEKQAVALSYADLGAALCEVAERITCVENGDEKWVLRDVAVGVTATGEVNASWGVLMGYLLKGAMGRVKEKVVTGVPFLYGPMAPFFVISMYGGYEVARRSGVDVF
ncbi:hypothetical protein VTI74DRAFT_5118 [Chaetomium olivicolor]